jgi:hypothetical protein
VDRKKRHEAVGEVLRELGVLMLIFVPLDVIFKSERFTTLDLALAFGALVAGPILIEIGIRVECE